MGAKLDICSASSNTYYKTDFSQRHKQVRDIILFCYSLKTCLLQLANTW